MSLLDFRTKATGLTAPSALLKNPSRKHDLLLSRGSPRLPFQLRCSQQAQKNSFDWCPSDFRADTTRGTTPLQVGANTPILKETNKGTVKTLHFPRKLKQIL